jgi:hypothetical protein
MSGSEPEISPNHPEAVPHAVRETPGKWTVTGIVGLGVFMATLDASIVNISLPKISLSFLAPLNGLVEWVNLNRIHHSGVLPRREGCDLLHNQR